MTFVPNEVTEWNERRFRREGKKKRGVESLYLHAPIKNGIGKNIASSHPPFKNKMISLPFILNSFALMLHSSVLTPRKLNIFSKKTEDKYWILKKCFNIKKNNVSHKRKNRVGIKNPCNKPRKNHFYTTLLIKINKNIFV